MRKFTGDYSFQVKRIEGSNKSKRNQILRELTALYTVSNVRLTATRDMTSAAKQISSLYHPSNSIPAIQTATKRNVDDMITVRAKEVKSRGPNTIILSLPEEIEMKGCHHPDGTPSRLVDFTILPPSFIIDQIDCDISVCDADSALLDRLKVIYNDTSVMLCGSQSQSQSGHAQTIPRDSSQGRDTNHTRTTRTTNTDTSRSGPLEKEKKVSLPSAGFQTEHVLTETRRGPCPYVVTFFDAYTDPANESE